MMTIASQLQRVTLVAGLAAIQLVLVTGASGCVASIGVEDVDPSADGDPGDSVLVNAAVTNAVLYVAPTGSDSNPGTIDRPLKSVSKGVSLAGPGSTLYLRGGTYVENVKFSVAKGTATSPIHMAAYTGERPVIQGLLWLNGANYWTLDGINVTWNSSNSSADHMVKMTGGSNWSIRNCEFWGAHSFAALLISGGATNVYVGYSTLHDTYKSNSTNQDHLIYANQVNGGVFEHNLFYNSPNGRGIKVGSLTNGLSMPANLVIRYNTFYNNLGPSNLQFSYSANHNAAYRNIMVKSSLANITTNSLSGTGNATHDNIGWGSTKVVATAPGLTDDGGNLHVDPQLKDPDHGDFHPLSAAAAAYGRYAP